MADLTEQQSSLFVKLTGTDLTGAETNPVDAPTSAPALSAAGLVVRPLPFESITYSAAAVNFILAAASTDVFMISGSATKTIKITLVAITMTTTSGSPLKVSPQLIKRSTLNTGASVAVTNVPHDSLSAAATASVKNYVVNPTLLGTAIGTLRVENISVNMQGVLGGAAMWKFTEIGEQPIVLRGVNENLVINLGGATVTGPVASAYVEWTEV